MAARAKTVLTGRATQTARAASGNVQRVKSSIVTRPWTGVHGGVQCIFFDMLTDEFMDFVKILAVPCS
jgi:hypothetical protein